MNTYTLEIARLRLVFEAEATMTFHRYLQPFLVQNTESAPDRRIVLRVAPAPQPKGELLFSDGRMAVYKEGAKEQRRYLMWSGDPASSENPALIPGAQREYTLYLPPSHAEVLLNGGELTPLLALEQLFAQNRRLILHSSVVLHNGSAVLFSAPSGVGKSTHAALWEQRFGAELLNGDRCVIEQTDSGFTAHGSPYSGSSEVCKRKCAPIKGIFLLRQAPENRAEPLSASAAFRRLFPQTVVNLWNPEQVQTVTDLLAALTAKLQVYDLACRPDIAAAELAEQILNSEF